MKAILKKRWFQCLALSLSCLAVVCIVLVACQQGEEKHETPKTDVNINANDDTANEAMQAKITYCEAQLQGLTTQLDTIEQQMYLMRQDYLDQIEILEQRFNEKVPEKEESNDGGTSDGDNAPTTDQGSQDNTSNVGGEVKLREYTYRLENNFAILTSYLGKETDVRVPAAVDGHLVIGLADRTFENTNVRSVTLPDTIEKIGWFTFYQCENLEKIVLPGRLSTIGYASFDGCAPSLCLYVKTGSYAQQFANSFGLRYEESQ